MNGRAAAEGDALPALHTTGGKAAPSARVGVRFRPADSIETIALVRPGSTLAREWKFAKPTFGIYEYSKAFDRHTIRFGDGSWQRLDRGDLADIVILDGSSDLVAELFD